MFRANETSADTSDTSKPVKVLDSLIVRDFVLAGEIWTLQAKVSRLHWFLILPKISFYWLYKRDADLPFAAAPAGQGSSGWARTGRGFSQPPSLLADSFNIWSTLASTLAHFFTNIAGNRKSSGGAEEIRDSSPMFFFPWLINLLILRKAPSLQVLTLPTCVVICLFKRVQ